MSLPLQLKKWSLDASQRCVQVLTVLGRAASKALTFTLPVGNLALLLTVAALPSLNRFSPTVQTSLTHEAQSFWHDRCKIPAYFYFSLAKSQQIQMT